MLTQTTERRPKRCHLGRADPAFWDRPLEIPHFCWDFLALRDSPSPPWGRGPANRSLAVPRRPLPLGEGGPPPALSSAGAGQVRGSRVCARPFAVHTTPLQQLGNEHATSSTFSRNLGQRCVPCGFRAVTPSPPGPSPPRGRGGNVETQEVAPRGGPAIESGAPTPSEPVPGLYSNSVCYNRRLSKMPKK